jgi:hypothetical protein
MKKQLDQGKWYLIDELAHFCGIKDSSMAEMMIWDGVKDFHSLPLDMA